MCDGTIARLGTSVSWTGNGRRFKMVSWIVWSADSCWYVFRRTLDELACESISTRSVCLPRRASAAASEMAVEVLPTPPFCEAIEITIYSVNWSESSSEGISINS